MPFHDSATIFKMEQGTFAAKLKHKFDEIDTLIEDGQTVTIDLTAFSGSVSFRIARDSVVIIDVPPAPREAGASSAEITPAERAANRFIFDMNEIQLNITPKDIQRQIQLASVQKKQEEPPSETAPMPPAWPPGVPNPDFQYHGDNWILTKDCLYTTSDGLKITAKVGFKTDLASIPRIFWPLLAPHELSPGAPVFHDLLYGCAGQVALPDGEVAPVDKMFTRGEADDIFLELMTRAEIKYWKRMLAYYSVRSFGSGHFRKKSAKKWLA